MPNLKDEKILKYLKDKGPNTSYQIAKGLEMSWSTIDTHCKNLFIDGKLDRDVKIKDDTKSTVWRLK